MKPREIQTGLLRQIDAASVELMLGTAPPQECVVFQAETGPRYKVLNASGRLRAFSKIVRQCNGFVARKPKKSVLDRTA